VSPWPRAIWRPSFAREAAVDNRWLLCECDQQELTPTLCRLVGRVQNVRPRKRNRNAAPRECGVPYLPKMIRRGWGIGLLGRKRRLHRLSGSWVLNALSSSVWSRRPIDRV